MNSGTCDFIIAQENEFVNSKMKLIVLFQIVFKLFEGTKNSALVGIRKNSFKCGEK